VNSPYALRVRDLALRTGDMREQSLDIAVPDTLGAGVIAVRTGAQMQIDLRFEALHEGILVSGHASAEATGECSRCLIDISEPVDRRLRWSWWCRARRGRLRRAVRV
jgi:uncharacterized protein